MLTREGRLMKIIIVTQDENLFVRILGVFLSILSEEKTVDRFIIAQQKPF